MKLQNLHEYKERVTFQRFGKVKTRAAGYLDEWIDVITVWAKVYASSSAEAFFAAEKQEWVTYMVEIMESVVGITSNMRINWVSNDNKTLEILSIRPDLTDGNVTEITTREKVWDENS